MNIVVRDTIEDDLEDIFRIRRDSLVRPHQFKLQSSDSIALYKQLLFEGLTYQCLFLPSEPGAFKCSTILRDNVKVGHISRVHYDFEGQKVCYCGWNIDPKYWRQGIASQALSNLFDSFFRQRLVDTIVSDCFSSNERGLRLLRKLNYQRGRIALHERLSTAIVCRSLHWILRFHLDAEHWQAAGRIKRR